MSKIEAEEGEARKAAEAWEAKKAAAEAWEAAAEEVWKARKAAAASDINNS